MKKKIIWLTISCLMVAALVLTSCRAPVTEEKEVKGVVTEPEKKAEKVEEVVKKEPQYGGSLSFWISFSTTGAEPASPDIAAGHFAPTIWLEPIQEKPVGGDIDKYGPRGTGEYEFLLIAYQPDEYKRGVLIESWELSPDKVVWHVRQGVYWAADNVDFMENRELTAEDVVADLLYFKDAPGGKKFREMSGDIYATDRYTLVIEYPSYNVSLMYYVGYEDRALISPPEMVAAGADKWENQVGTGPFMFKEYVVGSHMKYVRNPNYWDTTIIDGKEYQLPFVDEIVYPIITDEATQIAALRTGKLDYMFRVPPQYWSNLDRTAPELISKRYLETTGHAVGFKVTEPPFNNMDVRRALMIGTDIEAFAEIQKVGPLPIHWYPTYMGNPETFPALEDLPPETRLLYDYNPDLAKQMLADAGYPDGFDMVVNTISQSRFMDRTALLKDQWSKIGVDVEIKAHEYVTYQELVMTSKTYSGAFLAEYSGGDNPTEGLIRKGQAGHYFNVTLWENDRFEQLTYEMVKLIPEDERGRIVKEAALIYLNEVPYIPLDPAKNGNFWWPWIKNYYGEVAVGDYGKSAIYARMWVDQDLKAQLGK